MFNHNHYVPILKGKAGELNALEKLNVDTKLNMTPMIEVQPVERDYDTKEPKKSLDDHLSAVAKKIHKAWGEKQSLFIDLTELDLKERTVAGLHPATFINERFKKLNVDYVPTTGLDRDDDFNEAIAQIVANDNNDVCIRLEREDVISVELLKNDLSELMLSLGVSIEATHLLIDFKSIDEANVKQNAQMAQNLINTLPQISDYKTLTIAAAAMPESLVVFKPDSINTMPRTELTLWNLINKNASELKRIPSFGDYGVVHPATPEYDPRLVRPSAKIRYTQEHEWLILKGHSVRKAPGFKQYHSLSQQLVSRKEFIGSTFSWGDEYIEKCANLETTSGSLQTWVTIDTNHHLSLVSEQISMIDVF